MTKTALKGDLNTDIKQQMESMASLRKTIESISHSIYEQECRMWEQLRKENPKMSDNVSASIEDGVVVIKDRKAD